MPTARQGVRPRRLSFALASGNTQPRGIADPTVLGKVEVASFTNALNPLDVNGDGFVSSADVLGLVNLLNSQGSHALTASRGAGAEPLTQRMFWDTNGDGFVSPADLLLCVNYLNCAVSRRRVDLSRRRSSRPERDRVNG